MGKNRQKKRWHYAGCSQIGENQKRFWRNKRSTNKLNAQRSKIKVCPKLVNFERFMGAVAVFFRFFCTCFAATLNQGLAAGFFNRKKGNFGFTHAITINLFYAEAHRCNKQGKHPDPNYDFIDLLHVSNKIQK